MQSFQKLSFLLLFVSRQAGLVQAGCSLFYPSSVCGSGMCVPLNLIPGLLVAKSSSLSTLLHNYINLVLSAQLSINPLNLRKKLLKFSKRPNLLTISASVRFVVSSSPPQTTFPYFLSFFLCLQAGYSGRSQFVLLDGQDCSIHDLLSMVSFSFLFLSLVLPSKILIRFLLRFCGG
jgi:hypothetical protein